MKRSLHKTLAAAALALAASPAAASPTLVTSGGTLLGVDGIDVNGTLYDVTFQGGSCSAVFGTACDAPGSFAFSTSPDAVTANNALLAQVDFSDFEVLIASNQYGYDITGCGVAANSGSTACIVATPYESDGTHVNAIALLLRADASTLRGSPTYPVNTDPDPGAFTYADWTAVPEPASAAMLLPAVATIIARRRRKRRA